VWGTRVDESGAKLDAAPFLIASDPDDEDTFAVAGLGNDFVVAWHRERTNSNSLHLGRVAAGGQALDGPNGVEVTDPTENHYTPALACQATGCVVTWERGGQILGRAYGPTLAPAGPAFTVSGAASSQRLPTVVWDGARYLVAWEDSRSGLAVEAWATELEVDGTVRAPAGRLLVSPPYSLRAPSLAAAGPGQALLAYTVFDAAPQVHGNRVRAVAVLDLPNGEACSAPGQCTSGHCTDGVCCDAACGGGTVDCEACSAARGASANGVCTLLGLGASCRSSVGACDLAEKCDGVNKSCPADAWGPDGAVCNVDGACAAGVCIGGAAAVPGFVSTPGVFLTCSETFRYDGDGLPEVSGPGTPSFSLAPFPGSELPEGLTIDAATGALAWVPGAEQAGVHKVVLVVRGDGWAAGQVLELNVECEKRQLGVSCAHAPGSLGALGLVLLAALRRRPNSGRSR
jgi:Putative Ig domain